VRILILNQAFFPDVVSTAQHASDLARALVAEGNEVHVVCSQRAYDSPSVRFSRDENWDGVSIHRIPATGLGKATKWRRAIDIGSFYASFVARLCTLGRFDTAVALTSPPLISFVGMVFARLTRARLILWMMDINPDEAVAAGWLRQGSLLEEILASCLNASLRGAAGIVVLDRFMRDRIVSKGIRADRVSVIAPWIHSDAVHRDIEGRRRFRDRHGLSAKFVIMYSGNHSPCHPLDSLLEAAAALRKEPEMVFCFIGGGSEFKKVQEFARRRELHNILCLPYQPLNEISASLSAADLHAVVMGDPFVGIVHPCKIYNVMALGVPVLYIGPAESHIADLGCGQWLSAVRHGCVAEIAQKIVKARDAGPRFYEAECLRSREFAQKPLLSQLTAVIGDVIGDGSRLEGTAPIASAEQLKSS
jgi:colanic acid biosynthesis glycosyl transferase WcaI